MRRFSNTNPVLDSLRATQKRLGTRSHGHINHLDKLLEYLIEEPPTEDLRDTGVFIPESKPKSPTEQFYNQGAYSTFLSQQI